MALSVSATERKQIASTLHSGATCSGAAREHGRSKDTIRRIAREEGIDFVQAATQNAREARQRYQESERHEVVNEGLDKGRQLLSQCRSAADYQKLSVGLATFLDKHLLISGEATERGEYTNTQRPPSLEEELARLGSEMEAPGGLEGDEE